MAWKSCTSNSEREPSAVGSSRSLMAGWASSGLPRAAKGCQGQPTHLSSIGRPSFPLPPNQEANNSHREVDDVMCRCPVWHAANLTGSGPFGAPTAPFTPTRQVRRRVPTRGSTCPETKAMECCSWAAVSLPLHGLSGWAGARIHDVRATGATPYAKCPCDAPMRHALFPRCVSCA